METLFGLSATRIKDVLLMVSFSSSFATAVFLASLYLWWANRQFHFKKRQKDGSRLSSVATRQDVDEFRARQKQRQRAELSHGETEDDSSSASDSLTTVAEVQEGLGFEEEEAAANLSDYETDTDDDDTEDVKRDDDPQLSASFPVEQRQAVKDLTKVVSTLEVFNYLSSDAFVQCLEHMEYVDLPERQVLFDQDNVDGSLYAVLEGKVECNFEYFPQRNNTSDEGQADAEDDEDGPSIVSFTAGNGDVVTSLLSIVAGLVRKFQENDGDSLRTEIIPKGITVRAVGLAPTSKLVRVPPECYVAILEQHPRDVHQITHAIITRMERVILQTVVRSLGLQKEAVQRRSKESSVGTQARAEVWERLGTSLRDYVPGGSRPGIQERVEKDVATITASSIVGWHQNLELPGNANVVERIQKECTILSLAPGQTLIETGESHDALYLVLRGTLAVGMNSVGSAATSNQSTRRANVNPPINRRNIFQRNKYTKDTERPSSYTSGRLLPRRKGAVNSTAATLPTFYKIYEARVGDTVGRLSCFTGDASIVTIKNSSDWEASLLCRIPKETFISILNEHPSALMHCLGCLLDRLRSPITCLLDWNVEWMHVQAGEDVIYRGDACDAMYAVLNGRLSASLPAPMPRPGSQENTTGKLSAGATHLPSVPEPNPINTEPIGDKASFFTQARKRIQERHRKLMNRNKPTVAKAIPTPSRRRMHAIGDELLEEFGRGAIIGEVEFLTGTDWPLDIYASRHSELARIPVSVLNAIIRMCPSAGIHLARVVASQIQKRNARKDKSTLQLPNSPPGLAIALTGEFQNKMGLASSSEFAGTPGDGLSHGLSLATIAVVPLLKGDFDLDGFCLTLKDTLHKSIAPTALMTKAYARREMGEDVFQQRNAMHTLKLTRLCGDMEERSRLVVYQADSNYTWWTRLCIQQADCILLVVRAEEAPPRKKTEACLEWAFTALNAKIQLVVLHEKDQYEAMEREGKDETGTMESSDALNDWSEMRYWIAGHHLIRNPFRQHVPDFLRLCRRVTGRSVGVVLGGGGARGLAHIGVIKALLEAGVTVDFVGGTSQGAYIGALFARNPDEFSALVRAAKIMADSMSNTMEKLLDLTLPLVSFFSGYRFNKGIERSFGQRRIQDLVCNFFCVSTDLRNNVQVVHTKGLCWRYVRASMTLQNYLPPISEDGTLLVDGGYTNILPADVMKRQMRARTVIAVDVSQEVVLDNFEYGTHLNGWWLLWNSWNPFSKTVKIPSMGDISERLAWVNGDRQRKKVREDIDLFLQPPVANYGVLEYDKFEELVEIGYEYAKPRIENFIRKYPHVVS